MRVWTIRVNVATARLNTLLKALHDTPVPSGTPPPDWLREKVVTELLARLPAALTQLGGDSLVVQADGYISEEDGERSHTRLLMKVQAGDFIATSPAGPEDLVRLRGFDALPLYPVEPALPTDLLASDCPLRLSAPPPVIWREHAGCATVDGRPDFSSLLYGPSMDLKDALERGHIARTPLPALDMGALSPDDQLELRAIAMQDILAMLARMTSGRSLPTRVVAEIAFFASERIAAPLPPLSQALKLLSLPDVVLLARYVYDRFISRRVLDCMNMETAESEMTLKVSYSASSLSLNVPENVTPEDLHSALHKLSRRCESVLEDDAGAESNGRFQHASETIVIHSNHVLRCIRDVLQSRSNILKAVTDVVVAEAAHCAAYITARQTRIACACCCSALRRAILEWQAGLVGMAAEQSRQAMESARGAGRKTLERQADRWKVQAQAMKGLLDATTAVAREEIHTLLAAATAAVEYCDDRAAVLYSDLQTYVLFAVRHAGVSLVDELGLSFIETAERQLAVMAKEVEAKEAAAIQAQKAAAASAVADELLAGLDKSKSREEEAKAKERAKRERKKAEERRRKEEKEAAAEVLKEVRQQEAAAAAAEAARIAAEHEAAKAAERAAAEAEREAARLKRAREVAAEKAAAEEKHMAAMAEQRAAALAREHLDRAAAEAAAVAFEQADREAAAAQEVEAAAAEAAKPRAPKPYRPPPAQPALEPVASLLPPSEQLARRLDDALSLQPASFLPPAAGQSPAWLPPAASGSAGPSGLSNATGEYNCFLNSLVQSLFRLMGFTNRLGSAVFPPPTGADSPAERDLAVLRALQQLFVALGSGVELRKEAVGAAVAPTSLRIALAALTGTEGGVNLMADAAEVLGCLYDCFARVSGANHAGLARSPIHETFGLEVQEGARCGACGKVSHALTYTTFFHLVHAAPLRAAAAVKPRSSRKVPLTPQRALEKRLAGLLAAESVTKKCDEDAGGCGAAAPAEHALLFCPKVFTLSLTWDTASASEAEVLATMGALGESLRPARVYPASDALPASAKEAVYDARALVCYYGSHYACFTRGQADALWTRFDDAAVTPVGSWEEMSAAAARGHLQPTVVFYEQRA